MNNKEIKIENIYRKLFVSSFKTYIEKVAKAHECSVEKIVKISNSSPEIRKELEDNFLKIISNGVNK